MIVILRTLSFYAFEMLLVDEDQSRHSECSLLFLKDSQRHAANIRSLDGLRLPGRSLNSPSPAPSVVFSVSAHVYSPSPYEEEEEEEVGRKGVGGGRLVGSEADWSTGRGLSFLFNKHDLLKRV